MTQQMSLISTLHLLEDWHRGPRWRGAHWDVSGWRRQQNWTGDFETRWRARRGSGGPGRGGGWGWPSCSCTSPGWPWSPPRQRSGHRKHSAVLRSPPWSRCWAGCHRISSSWSSQSDCRWPQHLHWRLRGQKELPGSEARADWSWCCLGSGPGLSSSEMWCDVR